MTDRLVDKLLGILFSALLTTGGCLSTGCTVTLTGGGELSAGMRNDNFLVLRHTVDGDKVDKVAKSNLDAPSIEDWIKGNEEPDVPSGQ